MKKGYTLIELLATIAVLAIVSLIAFPKITDAIEKAKLNGAKTSAESYIHALEIAYVGNNLKSSDKWLSPDVYDAPLDSKYEIKVKGQKPSGGWISVDNDRIDEYSLQIGNYVVNFDGNITTVTKGNTLLEKPNYIFLLSYDENKMKDDEEFEYNMKYGLQNILFRGNFTAYCLVLSGTVDGQFINQDYCSALLEEASSHYGSDSEYYNKVLYELASSLSTPESCENLFNSILGDVSPDEMPSDFSHSCYKRDFKSIVSTNNIDKSNNKMYIKAKIDKENRVYDLSACINDDKEICISVKDDIKTSKAKIKEFANFDEKTWTKFNDASLFSSEFSEFIKNRVTFWTDSTKKRYFVDGNNSLLSSNDDGVGYEYKDYDNLKYIVLANGERTDFDNSEISSEYLLFELIYFDNNFLNKCEITYNTKEISCTAEKITDQNKLNRLKKEYFDE